MKQLYQPFSLLAQLNNLCLFMFAYVVKDQYQGQQCRDPLHQHFLFWIVQGAPIVYSITFALTILHLTRILDYIISLLGCGAVCVTIQALSFFALAIGFHIFSLVFGMVMYYLTAASSCLTLDIFTEVTGKIYSVELISYICYMLYSYWSGRRADNYLRV